MFSKVYFFLEKGLTFGLLFLLLVSDTLSFSDIKLSSKPLDTEPIWGFVTGFRWIFWSVDILSGSDRSEDTLRSECRAFVCDFLILTKIKTTTPKPTNNTPAITDTTINGALLELPDSDGMTGLSWGTSYLSLTELNLEYSMIPNPPKEFNCASFEVRKAMN